MKRAIQSAVLVLATVTATGCGYTREEYMAQGDKLARAQSKQRTAEQKAGELGGELEEARLRLADIEDRMRAMGVDLQAKEGRIGDLATTLKERERALAEYRAKAQRLEEIRARMELLRGKLNQLADVGIDVKIRKNRLVIVLPGDVLFDTNKDKIRKDGKDALRKVAEIIRTDAGLLGREYQVSGHTDDQKIRGGGFADNLQLSLARGRAVHAFLTDPKEGQLPRERWSAAGYADTDPASNNDSAEGRQANRRCEIVIVPALSEMLDLRQLVEAPLPKRATPSAAPSPAAAPAVKPATNP